MTNAELLIFRTRLQNKLQRGLFTRVAEQLGLGKSGRAHVSRVVSGERRSPRVEAAVRAEVKRIQRLIQQEEKKALRSSRSGRGAGKSLVQRERVA